VKGRLDHGRLRLGRRCPWLGLLRLRSGYAQGPLLRRPRLQAGRRGGGPAARRRPSAASAGGAAVQLPLPLLFSFTNSGAVAPARRVPPSGGLACRPAGDMGSSGAATSSSSTNGTPQRLQLLPSSSLSDSGATVDGLGIPMVARIREGLAGAATYKAAPRVSRHRSGRLGFLGFRAPSHAAASRGGRGRARCEARRLLARRPCVTVGIGRGRGKGEGKGELTDGPHIAVKQGEVKGRRAGWLCWAEMHRRAAA
jgi:hypothetical protein